MFSQCVRLKEVDLPEQLAKIMQNLGPQINPEDENACTFYVDGKAVSVTDNKKL